MFGMGMGELILILVVALLVLGPQKLPDAAKAIGKGIRELRRHTTDLQDTLEKDEHIGGTVRELRSALRGDDPSPSIRPPVKPRGAVVPSPHLAAPAPAGPFLPETVPETVPAADPTAPAAPAAPVVVAATDDTKERGSGS